MTTFEIVIIIISAFYVTSQTIWWNHWIRNMDEFAKCRRTESEVSRRRLNFDMTKLTLPEDKLKKIICDSIEGKIK